MAVYAQVGNVSEGGLFLRTPVPFPPGTEARLRFELPEQSGAHEVAAVVVWAMAEQGVGLRFEAPGEAVVSGIRRYVGDDVEEEG